MRIKGVMTGLRSSSRMNTCHTGWGRGEEEEEEEEKEVEEKEE